MKPSTTTGWFDRLADLKRDFLDRAQDAFLEYDRDAVLDLHVEGTALQRGYIFGRNRELANQHLEKVFKVILNQYLNPIPGSDWMRITALQITTNIPLDSVNHYRASYNTYKLSKVSHLYPQEIIAKEYETPAAAQMRQRGRSVCPWTGTVPAELDLC